MSQFWAATQRMRGRKIIVEKPNARGGVARFFQPNSRLMEATLKQMCLTDPEVPVPDRWVARAQADCLFLKRDRVVYGADIDFESTDVGQRANQIAIKRKRSFVFGNCFGVSSLCAKHLRHGR